MSRSTVLPSPPVTKGTGAPACKSGPTLYARVYAQLMQLLSAMAVR